MSAEPELIEGEVVEESTELVPRDPVSLFNTDDPVDVLAKATTVADALKRVVNQQGLIANIRGKEHPQVEAWQTLGSMLGVTAVCVHTEATTDRHGKPAYKATVEARYRGEVVGQADALCSTSEGRWKSADDYALLSMAQTRATSKALKGPLGWVMKLAGYESTPAEEMTFADPQPARATAARDGYAKIDDNARLRLIDHLSKKGRTRNEQAEFLQCEPGELDPALRSLSVADAREMWKWAAS